jgi:hypothetical protein
MLSRIGKSWHWYDWIFIGIIVIVIVGAIQAVAPTSGLAIALHQGFHFLALILGWLANFLILVASLLNQL